jgi:regulation of enolase protein 1 (concanavalin A-like superfamily)
MVTRRTRSAGLARLAAVGLGLALFAPGVAGADPPQSPWVTGEIGTADAAGSTDVDAGGVWTIQGNGNDVFFYLDTFHYSYQPVRGDGSITARFLSLEGGNTEWAKAGLMIRESDASGAPNLFMPLTRGHGLHATYRQEMEGPTFTWNRGEVGPSRRPQPNLLVRLQRAGQEITGFYSTDGLLWTQAFSPVTMPALREQALWGLAITSHRAGVLATATFDQVRVQPGSVSVTGLQACTSDRSVLLQWRPVPGASGYNLYRGAPGTPPDQLQRLTSDQITTTTFTDTSGDLANGTAMTYVVAPVVNGVEGPKVAVQATPTALPAGFFGCSVDEGPKPGSASVDPATGQIVLRHSGDELFFDFDNLYFMGRVVDGDFQVTVRALSAPSGPNPLAGLMVRETLDPQARHMTLAVTNCCITEAWRLTTGASPFASDMIERDGIRLPLLLRLTRRGNTITPEYSRDEGKTFRLAGPPITFNPPLATTLSVGVGAGSGSRHTAGTARFQDLTIQKLPQ